MKDEQCSSSPFESQNVKDDAVAAVLCFRERRCALSLDFRPIGPSVLDGARSKVALRDKGYAWALILWNSDNSKR